MTGGILRMVLPLLGIMFEGRIAGSFAADEADIDEIGLLMTGGRAGRDEAAPAGSGAIG